MATDADIRRSTPGYVYGVGIRVSRQEEGTPDCPCPCHRADRPRGARGIYCNKCWSFTLTASYPEVPQVDYSHEQAIADGTANPRPHMVSVPDYYFITKGNTLEDELGEHFETAGEADARAEELNTADVLASLDLDPTLAERRSRLKGLGETFWVRYGEGHREARWPKEPGRYAIEEYAERYSESFWETVETLAEVEEAVRGGDVVRVVDLDTGKDVPFTVAVSFAD